ncbi:hypothetical protein Q7P37_003743 [Cladosporium fusiforme]
MKILFICTAHNSLSQRLYLALSKSHDVTIEYAISDQVMLEAVALANPDLVICPFLTTFVPKKIYEDVLTLIIHPGPPGDAGPSSIDWLLLGDDGSIADEKQLPVQLSDGIDRPGRSHWGVTVLQAIEEFDAGPIWAYQQFPVDIDDPKLTKSSLYRGDIAQAAIVATTTAVRRIENASLANPMPFRRNSIVRPYNPKVQAKPEYGQLSVSDNQPFQGGTTYVRPLLKASLASFDISRHSALHISRRIRSSDSQPGVMSKAFGPNMYVYGGTVDDTLGHIVPTPLAGTATGVLAVRDSAICIATVDNKGIWISHVRRSKTKMDKALWPKVPAVPGLVELGILDDARLHKLRLPHAADFSLTVGQTYKEVWVEFHLDENLNKSAYLHFEHYNGAMSTDQCSKLIEAMDYILASAATDQSIRAVVLMGGAYFSNGIALNVIEASADPSQESWLNINRIDDVVHYLLHDFPSRNILTIAAVRGNAAAGGVALATACDFVIAGSEVVLNPSYRAIGLYGSEYHTLSYYGRCGEANASKLLKAMLPMSPLQARQIGLVDFIFPGAGRTLDEHIHSHVALMLKESIVQQGTWKYNLDLSPPALALARANELAEMSKDFWSPRSIRYHSRRYDFVRKSKATKTPLRFAVHRRGISGLDEEETSDFDDIQSYKLRAKQKLLAGLRASVWTEAAGAAEQDGCTAEKRLLPLVPPIDLLTPPPIEKPYDFACHYKPTEAMLTPPESPMHLGSPNMGGEDAKVLA